MELLIFLLIVLVVPSLIADRIYNYRRRRELIKRVLGE